MSYIDTLKDVGYWSGPGDDQTWVSKTQAEKDYIAGAWNQMLPSLGFTGALYTPTGQYDAENANVTQFNPEAAKFIQNLQSQGYDIVGDASNLERARGSYKFVSPTGQELSAWTDKSQGLLEAVLPMALMAFPGLGTTLGTALGASGTAASVLGSGLLSGTMSELQGGNFLQGALQGAAGAGLGGMVNPSISDALGGGAAGNIAANAITSGTLAELQGGDFLTSALKGAVSAGANEIQAANATDADIAGGMVPEYGSNAAYDSVVSNTALLTGTPEIPPLFNELQGQMETQQSQINILASQYQELGLTQQQAFEQAARDMQQTVQGVSSDFSNQLNNQATQYQTLLDQYQQAGLTQQEATSQALADMGQSLQGLETNLGTQINTQGEQFQTLLQQYRDLGLDENVALQQTVDDMGTNLSTQINTQGEQFQTLLQQYRDLGMEEDVALQQTLSDMQQDTSGMFSDLSGQLAEQQTTTEGLFDTISGQGDLLSLIAQLTFTNMFAPAIASQMQASQPQAPALPAYKPQDTMPSYSPDYFNQVQNYYTGYMPNAPRDVATPLQDWYNTGYTGEDSVTKKLFGV